MAGEGLFSSLFSNMDLNTVSNLIGTVGSVAGLFDDQRLAEEKAGVSAELAERLFGLQDRQVNLAEMLAGLSFNKQDTFPGGSINTVDGNTTVSLNPDQRVNFDELAGLNLDQLLFQRDSLADADALRPGLTGAPTTPSGSEIAAILNNAQRLERGQSERGIQAATARRIGRTGATGDIGLLSRANQATGERAAADALRAQLTGLTTAPQLASAEQNRLTQQFATLANPGLASLVQSPDTGLNSLALALGQQGATQGAIGGNLFGQAANTAGQAGPFQLAGLEPSASTLLTGLSMGGQNVVDPDRNKKNQSTTPGTNNFFFGGRGPSRGSFA